MNKVSVTIEDKWDRSDRKFTRTIPFDKLNALMTAAEVAEAKQAGRLHEVDGCYGFYLDQSAETRQEARLRVHQEAVAKPSPASEFEAMRETLREGVQVVAAPQLFPTPSELAKLLVESADIEPGHRVLEPSAGTGALLRQIPDDTDVVAVEINYSLAEQLRSRCADVRCCDFLECNGDLGKFDRIVMNPPFENGADIKHIQHARRFLNSGGRLVAICANGPRQRAQLMPEADSWLDLPQDSFKQAGTGVNTAIAVFYGP